ncbi:MAG TPA: hypothetical protein VIR27_10880 [Mycobacteriales bacterium]
MSVSGVPRAVRLTSLVAGATLGVVALSARQPRPASMLRAVTR